MTANVWDNKVGQTPGAQTALGGYTHIQELLQAMRYDPNNAQATAAGNKLQDALTTKTFSVPTGVNGAYASKLDHALADKATRDRIVKLSQENPAALNQAMDQITQHPENTTAIVNNIRLPSEQQVAQAAPSKSAQQSPITQHHRAPVGSGSSPATTAKKEPVHDAPATAASGPPASAPREKPPVIAEERPSYPVSPSSPDSPIEHALGIVIGNVSSEALMVARQIPGLDDPRIIGTLSEISRHPDVVAHQVIAGANDALRQLSGYTARRLPHQQMTQFAAQQVGAAATPSITAPNGDLKRHQPLSLVQTTLPPPRIAMSLQFRM